MSSNVQQCISSNKGDNVIRMRYTKVSESLHLEINEKLSQIIDKKKFVVIDNRGASNPAELFTIDEFEAKYPQFKQFYDILLLLLPRLKSEDSVFCNFHFRANVTIYKIKDIMIYEKTKSLFI